MSVLGQIHEPEGEGSLPDRPDESAAPRFPDTSVEPRCSGDMQLLGVKRGQECGNGIARGKRVASVIAAVTGFRASAVTTSAHSEKSETAPVPVAAGVGFPQGVEGHQGAPSGVHVAHLRVSRDRGRSGRGWTTALPLPCTPEAWLPKVRMFKPPGITSRSPWSSPRGLDPTLAGTSKTENRTMFSLLRFKRGPGYDALTTRPISPTASREGCLLI